MAAAKAGDEERAQIHAAADLLCGQGLAMRSLASAMRARCAVRTARLARTASPAITLLVAGTEREEHTMARLLNGAQHVVMVRTAREAVRVFLEATVTTVILSGATEEGHLLFRELADRAQAHFGILVHESSPTAPRVLRWQS